MPASQAKAAEIEMPHSVEAERAILGAVLLDNAKLYEADEHLTGDEFSLTSHAQIFAAIRELDSKGSQADIITLSEHLRQNGKLADIGGVPYLASLTDGAVIRTSVLHYIKIVREKYLLRRLIEISRRTAMRAYDQSDPVDDQFADLQQSLIDMIYRGRQVGVNLQQTGREMLTEMEKVRNLPAGEIVGIETPLPMLDELTTGFRNTELCIVGARPGNGKTAFMCQGVRRQVLKGRKPGIFSIEVPRDQIIMRLACQETGINVFDARDNRVLSVEDYKKLWDKVAEISATWDFFLEDGRMTPKRVAAIARAWVAKGCDCIWVDYLGKLAARTPGKTEYERVTAACDALWEIGRYTGVPINALCQLKRIEADDEPTMEDLRSSGEIEQNAHLIFLLHRGFTVSDGGMRQFTGQDKIIIAKQRSGPANEHIPVRFNAPVGLFEEKGDMYGSR